MGALTLKAFSDELREWELLESEGIDPTDGFGTSLRISVRENQIFLAEPFDLETPWITDKGRLFFDGMFRKNLTESLDWNEFFYNILEFVYFFDHFNLKTTKACYLMFVFENLSLESLSLLYLLSQKFSFLKLRRFNKYTISNDLESNFQINSSTLTSKLNKSTIGLLLNVNTRYEGSHLNLSLRQRLLKGNFKLFTIGPFLDLTFSTSFLGSNLNIFTSICEGTHYICQNFRNSEFPLLITNLELFKRTDMKHLVKMLKHTKILNNSWFGLNILHPNISSFGLISLNNFLPLTLNDLTNFWGLYMINTPLIAPNFEKTVELKLLNLPFKSKSTVKNFLLIDQNKNLFSIPNHKNYFYVPSNLFLEENETYTNTQGIIKRVTKLINFKKEAKSNWQIIRKLFNNFKKLFFISQQKNNELINFSCFNLNTFNNYSNFNFHATQVLTSVSFYLTTQNKPLLFNSTSLFKNTQIKIKNTKLKFWLDDFFTTGDRDLFSNNSALLINCSKIARQSSTNFF